MPRLAWEEILKHRGNGFRCSMIGQQSIWLLLFLFPRSLAVNAHFECPLVPPVLDDIVEE